MKKNGILTIFCFICFLAVCVQAHYRQYCSTLHGHRGTCVPIQQCEPVNHLIRRNPFRAFGVIYRTICFSGYYHIGVCCPPQRRSYVYRTTEKPYEKPRVTSTALPPTKAPMMKKPLQPPDCGYTNLAQNRIVGGTPTSVGAWPWVAAIGIRFDDDPKDIEFICGGSLVSSRHIVTAAHCLDFKDVKYLVRLGEYNLKSDNDGANPVDLDIEKVTVHPRYNNSTKENDIGIIKLAKDVKFTKFIHPICLPLADNLRHRDYVGSSAWVAGWGAVRHNGPSSNTLREAQVTVERNADCKKSYENKTVTIDDRVLCAANPSGGKDACQGDSGGPLMLQQQMSYYQIGIVSTGFKCAVDGYPGIYTRTTHFLEFILSNLN